MRRGPEEGTLSPSIIHLESLAGEQPYLWEIKVKVQTPDSLGSDGRGARSFLRSSAAVSFIFVTFRRGVLFSGC